MVISHAPKLVRTRAEQAGGRWSAHIPEPDGFLRIVGGAGTGKSALLAEIAARRILDGGQDHVLVLTANRRAAGEMRTAITRELSARTGPLRTAREPLVRTVHSYAFGVLRLQSSLAGAPPPRLLSGPEQDAVVRDLLAGDIEDGARCWPSSLRPALGLPGFAAELRDLLLRAAERGLGPEHLLELGKRHDRPEWVAAGKFGKQYEEVTLLQGAVGAEAPQATAAALDAAELVASARLAFDTDPRLLAAERARVRYLLVDDAQHLDPQQYALLRMLGDSATEFILAGDQDQAVFSFRGADSRLFTEAEPDHELVLRTQFRMGSEIANAVNRLATRLPGTHRETVSEPDAQRGSVDVRLFASAAAEANWIAAQLRRAHLLEEIPWSRMAVLTRSVAKSVTVLRRALLSAGVPITLPSNEIPLPAQTAVQPFLALLRCAADAERLDAETAAMLLSSQLGGADPLTMRRVRRGLRRLEFAAGGRRASEELLVEALRDNDILVALEPDTAAPVRRVAKLLTIARDSMPDGLELVLWRVWQASGLERRWVEASARGGHTGMKADRDLDAMVALFEAAGRYVDRLPGASVVGFADYLGAQQIAGDSLAPTAPKTDAVPIVSAHASAGREWDVVAIAGVTEGSWPDLRTRGTLFGVEELVDLLSGVDSANTSAVAPLLADERRLLLVAASRARQRLLVSSVRGEEEQPSRFLEELVAEPGVAAQPLPALHKPERGLVLAELIGELRTVVCDEDADPERAQRAAVQLARLADAGVPGADPDSWYGTGKPSVDSPLWNEDEPVSVSPSTVELLVNCPLRWMVQRHGGTDPAELPAITGSLVHALAQAAGEGAEQAEIDEQLAAAWSTVEVPAPWFSRRELTRLRGMLSNFDTWLSNTRGELTQLALERDVDLLIDGERQVRLRGRVDRLETDRDGRPVVIDIKTSKTAVTADAAREHAQLAVYQLAASLGAFPDATPEPGGARLLYLAKANQKTGATERNQPAPDEDKLAEWRDVVVDAAKSSAGPDYLAVESSDCPTCPVRTSCPLQENGRQVTE